MVPFETYYIPINPTVRSSKEQRVLTGGRSWVSTCLNRVMRSNREPRAIQRFTDHGSRYFRFYDPLRDTYRIFNCEAEVRDWLDSRYAE